MIVGRDSARSGRHPDQERANEKTGAGMMGPLGMG